MMDWNATVHSKLAVPVLPPFEQLVIVYVASQRQYAIGYYRAGTWQVHPPPAGTVTHWAALTPPGVAVPVATSTTVRRDRTPPPSPPLKPPYRR
jgi:hypothetical protein